MLLLDLLLLLLLDFLLLLSVVMLRLLFFEDDDLALLNNLPCLVDLLVRVGPSIIVLSSQSLVLDPDGGVTTGNGDGFSVVVDDIVLGSSVSISSIVVGSLVVGIIVISLEVGSGDGFFDGDFVGFIVVASCVGFTVVIISGKVGDSVGFKIITGGRVGLSVGFAVMGGLVFGTKMPIVGTALTVGLDDVGAGSAAEALGFALGFDDGNEDELALG